MGWWQRWRAQRECFHHDHARGISWIRSELIDLGRRKLFWCAVCDRRWTT